MQTTHAYPTEPTLRESVATRTVVGIFGALAALAGIEHGVGEIVQGAVAPDGLIIESWPDAVAMEILGGEPALTMVPDLLVSGVLAVAAAVALGVWAVGFAHRRRGGPVLVGLAILLLLVGGGFGPPLVGLIIGLGTRMGTPARRQSARATRAWGLAWPWLTAAGALGFLGLIPGVPLLGIESAGVVASLTVVAFAGLVLALVAARARGRGTAGGYPGGRR